MSKTQLVNLSQYRFNSYSQCGEDGVIAKIMECLEITSGHLVEFGAWDGIYLSNTAHHWRSSGCNFDLLLIEGDSEKFAGIVNNYGPKVQRCNEWISIDPDSPSTINKILDRYGVKDIALMSIDVDGTDLLIWQSLDKKKYSPKILVIEWGNMKYVLSDEFISFFKGYTYVYCTGNHIFVRNDLGVKQPASIPALLQASGHPEIDVFLGNILQSECDGIIASEEFKEKDYYSRVAKPVWVEFNTQED